jgi:cbb3-type cytochrome oxidase subunit 3
MKMINTIHSIQALFLLMGFVFVFIIIYGLKKYEKRNNKNEKNK